MGSYSPERLAHTSAGRRPTVRARAGARLTACACSAWCAVIKSVVSQKAGITLKMKELRFGSHKAFSAPYKGVNFHFQFKHYPPSLFLGVHPTSSADFLNRTTKSNIINNVNCRRKTKNKSMTTEGRGGLRSLSPSARAAAGDESTSLPRPCLALLIYN
ncbi:hypothetical protein EVAR_27196_1 [Eumeta japonica]|uniref:Uncharacterized protein n=1 Tax=Eumeta variegata TaxID=151549 RepID=A0A4C1VVR4_EUMVA|nr:hypothetical protein EVAR_27196_1 [Eumeta japonica]